MSVFIARYIRTVNLYSSIELFMLLQKFIVKEQLAGPNMMQDDATGSDGNLHENINFENLDFRLVEATLASIATRTLTPIIKEELKLKIQSKRLASGEEELPPTVFQEPPSYQVRTR